MLSDGRYSQEHRSTISSGATVIGSGGGGSGGGGSGGGGSGGGGSNGGSNGGTVVLIECDCIAERSDVNVERDGGIAERSGINAEWIDSSLERSAGRAKQSDGGDGIAERSHGSERSNVNAERSVGSAERSVISAKQGNRDDGIAERGDGSAERTTSAPRKTWWRMRDRRYGSADRCDGGAKLSGSTDLSDCVAAQCVDGTIFCDCSAQHATSSTMEVE